MTIILVLTQKEQQMLKASSAWRLSDHSEGTQANNPLPEQFRKSTELLAFFFFSSSLTKIENLRNKFFLPY